MAGYRSPAYAVCKEHVADAVDYMLGRTVKIVEVKDSKSHICHCMNQAIYFFREVPPNA